MSARTRPPHVPTEVFVSHSHKDQAFVEWLVGVLRRHQIPVGYSVTEIQGAQQWHDEIGRALKRCDWFVVILSPDAVASTWVKRELLYTLQQDRFEGRIAPVVYRTCDYEQLSWILPQLQIIDFTGSFDEGCRDLLSIWGVHYTSTDPS